MIQNNLSSRISLTRMELLGTKSLLTHQWIGDKYYPKFKETDIPGTERQLSNDFPIHLIANAGTICKVIFDFQDKEFSLPPNPSLHITTNKKEKTFTIDCSVIGNNQLYV